MSPQSKPDHVFLTYQHLHQMIQIALIMGVKWTDRWTMAWYEHSWNVYNRLKTYYHILMPIESTTQRPFDEPNFVHDDTLCKCGVPLANIKNDPTDRIIVLWCCWRRLHEQCFYEWRDALKKSGSQLDFCGEIETEWTNVQTKCDCGQSITKGLLKSTLSEHMNLLVERIEERLECGERMLKDGTLGKFLNQPDPDRTSNHIEPLTESGLWKDQIPGHKWYEKAAHW